MVFTTWRQWRKQLTKASKMDREGPQRGHRRPPSLERLEDRTLLSVSLINVPHWLDSGPGPILNNPNTTVVPNNSSVGAIESIAVEPTSSGYIVYAGTVNGGIWRSDNITDTVFTVINIPKIGPVRLGDPAAIAWQPLTDQQPSLSTTSMALDPLDPSGNTLWVATGSLSSFNGVGGPAVGLLRTTDGDSANPSWSLLGQTDLRGQTVLRVVPTTIINTVPGPINVVTGQVVLVAALGKGVLRSVDTGITFSPVNQTNGPNGAVVGQLTGSATDLVADPNNSTRFYAALPGQGVFESDDGGLDWYHIDKGNAAITGSTLTRLAVTLSPVGVVLYVGVAQSPFTFAGVYRSEDQGPWSPIGAGPSLPAIGFANYGAFPMVADPTNPYVVYVSEAFRGDASANAGLGNWTYLQGANANSTQVHADPRGLAFLSNTTLLESGDGGIYGLSNPVNVGPNDQWVAVNGNIRNTEFFAVAYDSINGLIIGGTQDNGSSVQTAPNSGQWTALGGGSGDGGLVAVDPNGVRYYFSNRIFLRDGAVVQLKALASDANPYTGLNPADAAAAAVSKFSATYPFALNPGNASRSSSA